MEEVLRPLIVIGGSLAVTVIVGWAVDRLLVRLDHQHPEMPLWGLLRRCRAPFQVLLCAGLLRGTYRETRLLHDEDHWNALALVLSLIVIGSVGWLAIHVAATAVEASYARYAAGNRDPARARRVRTQLTLVQRVATAVISVMAAAVALLQFPVMRTFGASMLASAGVLGIVAGIAAQSVLSNLFAGLQIAFGDTVRIGDTVVVEGEMGTVHEITLSYLVVQTWDERMITMPVSYFTSKPFENWSRGGAQMTGTVYFQLDHAAPIAAIRERLRTLVHSSPTWDGRAWNLLVTDTTPTTIEVRALATARNPDDVWSLRCQIREEMVTWLREEHPYALPRIPTAPAPRAFPHQEFGTPIESAATEAADV